MKNIAVCKSIIIGFLISLVFSSSKAQDKPEVVITQGHIDNVSTIDFSPDNKYIATGSNDRTIRLWYRALQQEYRVLLGHRKMLTQVTFSPDGKYLVSLDGMDLIVWEVPEGKIKHRLKVDAFTKHFSFIPGKGNQILFTNAEDKKVIYDIDKGQILKKLDFGLTMVGWAAHPTKSCYLMCERPDSVMAYDINGKRVQTLAGKGFYQKIIISADGKLVAGFSISGHEIRIWDFDTGESLKTIKTNPAKPINQMIFNGDASTLWTMSWSAEIEVFDVNTAERLMLLNENKISKEDIASGNIRSGIGFDMSLSRDKKVVGVALTLIRNDAKVAKGEDLRGVLLLDAETGKELGMLKGYFKWINHLSVGPTERYMVSANFGKDMGLRIWDTKDGEVDRYIRSGGFAAASGDGRKIAFIEYYELKKPELRVYSFPNFQKLATFDVMNLSAIALNQDGSRLAALRVDQNLQDPLNSRFYISVWDVSSGEEIKQIEIKSNESPWFWGFRLSAEGDYILAETGSGMRVWSVETGEAISLELEKADYEHLIAVAPNQPHLIVSQTNVIYNEQTKKVEPFMHLITLDYTSGKRLNDFNTQQEGVLLSGAFSQDGKYLVTGQTGYFKEINFDVVVWDWASKTEVCRLKGHHGGVKHLCFGPKGKKIYSAAEDGFIKVWNWEECKLAASLIGMNKLDYIILSPDNYYKTSKGNAKGIGFRFQNNLYTYDQFDLRFNRPDKVLENLGVSPYSLRVYTKAWEKRVKRMGYTPEMLESGIELPEVKIVNRDQLPFSTTEEELELEVAAIDPNARLDRIKVYVNDVPYPKIKGYNLRKAQNKEVKKKLKIPLSQGQNLVKVSVMNKNGLESVRESFEIEYQAEDSKPNLYLFTIGVSEFKDNERNLKYAKKDAEDLIQQFKQTGQYGEVMVKSFYNEEATAKNIQKAERFLEEAGINDHVMIYVSTHGVLDDSLNYYLAMHDMDFNAPAEKGLPYEQIDRLLDGLKCRNRLVLIDACHSGEVDKSEAIVKVENISKNVRRRSKSGRSDMIRPKTGLRNSFTYMQELFSNLSNQSGATVISAASGYEFALESEEWNNGVFTYAILQGLQTKEADLDEDAKVLISELKWYVVEKVGKLTQGQQHPTTRKENDLNDFVIYQY
jgi:WD40 repeat protein